MPLPKPEQFQDWRDWAKAFTSALDNSHNQLTTKVSEFIELENNLINSWVNAVPSPADSNLIGRVHYLSREIVITGSIYRSVTPAVLSVFAVIPLEWAPKFTAVTAVVVQDSAGGFRPGNIIVPAGTANMVLSTSPGYPAGGVGVTIGGLRWLLPSSL